MYIRCWNSTNKICLNYEQNKGKKSNCWVRWRLNDKNYLNIILEKGAKKADLIAKNNLKEIYKIIGLTKFT